MTQLGHLWRGELALGNAFWTWAVYGGLLINVASIVLFLVLIMTGHQIAAVVAGHIVSVPYNVLVAVGVWRSADRHAGDRLWAEFARYATVIGAIVLSVA